MSKIKKPKRRLSFGVFALIFFLTFMVSCPLSWRLAESGFLQNVEGTNPEWFSVLAFMPDNVEIVNIDEIDDFARSNPNYSFLVPEGQEKVYRDKLTALFIRKSIDASPDFEVRRMSADRQAIKFSIYGDGATVREYEALDKKVFPKTSKMYGPLFIIFPAFYSLIIAIGLTVILRLVWAGHKFANRRKIL